MLEQLTQKCKRITANCLTHAGRHLSRLQQSADCPAVR